MSENGITSGDKETAAAEQAKSNTNKPAKPAKTTASSQAPRRTGQQATRSDAGKTQSVKELERRIDKVSQNIDKQSRLIQQAISQITSLQKSVSQTDRATKDMMTFIKNRGWKKKGKKK